MHWNVEMALARYLILGACAPAYSLTLADTNKCLQTWLRDVKLKTILRRDHVASHCGFNRSKALRDHVRTHCVGVLV